MRTSRGFTLIELLVVILIFAVFSLMAYGSLDSVLKTRAGVEEAMEQTAALQKAYMKARDDFQQVRNRGARDGYGDSQPSMHITRDGRLEFTRGGWRNPLLLPRPGLERVSYRLDGEKLKRESWRVLDQAQDSKVVELVLFDDVRELRWRFLDDNREWQDSWPPRNASNSGTAAVLPPLAVEMQFDSKRWGVITWLFRPGVMKTVPAAAPTPGTGGTPNPNGTPNPGTNPGTDPNLDTNNSPQPGELTQ